jgi:hypothetical protein
MRAARVTVMNLQSMAAKRLFQAQTQKLEARLEDLQVWEQRKVKDTKKGAKAYTYYLASWREGGKLRNVYLGSSQRKSSRRSLGIMVLFPTVCKTGRTQGLPYGYQFTENSLHCLSNQANR